MPATLLHPNKLKMEWKQHVLGAHRVVSLCRKCSLGSYPNEHVLAE